MNHNTEHVLLVEPALKKTILVVEDDVSLGVKIVEAISHKSPYAALLLLDSLMLEKVIELIQPELVILEEHLANTNSIASSSHLHTIMGLRNIPLLMLCADSSQTEMKKSKIPGVRKPFELDDLLSIIEQVVTLASYSCQ